MPITSISIPQAKTARLEQSMDAELIKSIFTANFATCNVVIFANKDKLSVTHADFRTTEDELLTELAWVGNDCEIYIIHHPSHPTWGNHNKDRFAKCLPKAKTIEVPENFTGIEATFKTDGNVTDTNALPSWITPYPRGKSPANCAYHPDQHKFSTAHSIEEYFRGGAMQYYSENKLRKTNIIFNGHWCVVNPSEFIPHIGEPRRESAIFRPKQCYEDIDKLTPGVMGWSATVSFYANGYDIYTIFRGELNTLISYLTKTLQIAWDKDAINSFKNFFQAPPKNNIEYYKEFIKIYNAYQANADESPFKKEFCEGVNQLLLYFKLQEDYQVNISVSKSFETKLTQQKENAADLKKQGKFEDAILVYLECINLAKLAFVTSNPEHANLSYLLASAYFSNDNYEATKTWLVRAAQLHQQSTPKNPELETRLGILSKACEERILSQQTAPVPRP